MKYDLEQDLYKSKKITSTCIDINFARKLYAALCNMQWVKINAKPEDEKIIDRLKGENPPTWSCSWRAAGGIVAELRNKVWGKNEDYMDFYCSGGEGKVDRDIEECLNRLGWFKKSYRTDDGI